MRYVRAMKPGLAVIVLWAAACGSKEPAAGGRGSAIAPVRPAEAIALATVTHGNARLESVAAYLGGKLVDVDPAGLGIDDQGRVTPSSGSWHPVTARPPAGTATVVVVDSETPAAEVRTALAAFADRCVGFLGAQDRVPAAVMPDPCTARPNDAEEVELAVWVDKDKILVGLSRVNEVTEVSPRSLLEAALQQHKASAFFADRKDLVIAVHGDAMIGEVIELLDLAHGAGFTAARWVEPAQLPLEIAEGIGTNRPRPPGTVATVSIGQPDATGDLDPAIIRRYIKRNIQKITACYQKRLTGKPGLAGTVQTEFFITPSGKVSRATASGVDPEVASCVADVIKTIGFPKPKGDKGVQVAYPFVFRPVG
jgi:hypothetical protein